ncbi:efflux RND transporter periplasmic adaptor subunit [uncultured Flavonifractor sp.]|uniref:efflux RND transporter periplasmic adaptor subunit n=1 Tax=uncultured Flavonifractor sp. TaxID=1193534 RepID=UPI00262ECB9C|nr:efflux RND transporter periplasmic adaptor subunit [uncultured Flavonifractor sp.]
MAHNKKSGRRVLACLMGLALLAGCSQENGGETTTVFPDVGPVENTVEDTGTVTYRDNYTIVPQVGGTVVSCAIAEGDAVTAGQELYVIDAGELEDQIEQARLSLDSAQATLSQAQAACEDLSVVSYASGTVTAVLVHVGDFVSSGTPVAQVVDDQNLTLTVPFFSQDAAGFAVGDSAVISFPSRGETVDGTVKRVYDTPSALSGGRSGVYVELAFRNPGTVLSGDAASASVGAAACMDTGSVSYATEQSIYAAQSGQVMTLPLEAGSAVTAGQTVMTIKNDSLTNAVTNAALSVESARTSLEQLEAKRSDYTILAPADGIILTRSVKAGDLAAAGSPMAVLAQPEELCVHAQINEQYIERIWPGQQAQISFTDDTGQARSYTGTVARIDDTGITSGGVTDYTVELSLDDLTGLRDGMNVSVAITTERKEDCLRVPSRAVSGGTVQVLRDGKAVEVPVETGLSGGGYTEILQGLTAEDAVILP